MNSKTYNFEGFVGVFKDLIIQFVNMKQALGFSYFAEAGMLKRFSKFTLKYTITKHILEKELADAWTEKRPTERDITREKRIHILRQFAIFLNELGYNAYIPFCNEKADRNLFTPYIFTHEQINRFFDACEVNKTQRLSRTQIIFPAIYRLLYGCGLRISEALALKLKDVDLNNGILTIYGSKFKKDRLVPMSASLTSYLKTYSSSFHATSKPDDYFFIKRDKTGFEKNTVYKYFRKILWRSAISHGGKGRGPRLHDFRHTFSVHSLNQMVRQGIDPSCALVYLSTYLGHASITATEKYVRLTAEVYPEVLDSVRKTCAYIFPEVNIK